MGLLDGMISTAVDGTPVDNVEVYVVSGGVLKKRSLVHGTRVKLAGDYNWSGSTYGQMQISQAQKMDKEIYGVVVALSKKDDFHNVYVIVAFATDSTTGDVRCIKVVNQKSKDIIAVLPPS